MRLAIAALALLALSACGREKAPAAPVFHAEGYPERLSDWNLISAANGVLTLNARAIPYDLATPLFSDYALKLRTVTLPDGLAAAYDVEHAFDFPVGTIISKTFYYPKAGGAGQNAVTYGPSPALNGGAMPLQGLRLIETRLLVRRAKGWTALPYVWNEEQTEARLNRIGAVKPMTLVRPDGRRENFAYLVPNETQCAGCHATNNTTRAIEPIGLKARHLNKDSSYNEGFNQLDWWTASGMLNGAAPGAAHPRNAAWTDESASLDARARAYLDANCSHCHSDVGPADTSGLDLRPQTPMGPKYGRCKFTIAAGGGAGGRRYDIVPGDPDKSIFVYRMETTNPGHMMPELGRSVTHEEGVRLIADWIRSLEGACG
ncbi:MAG TPA: hypothetical protein DDZ68_05420 [Parvularcula sp.]|nr:hypothetical protein [Parvularcula sp.]HBS32359.1 hypothetical protein [Parvularcula sp.]HBS34857.1 hypothetical protein [Parvularcula sp.]